MDRVIFKTKLTDLDTAAKDPLGSIRGENGKFYKYVLIKNVTATVAGVAGDPVSYFAATGYSTNQVVLDATDADAQPIGAGFLMTTVVGTAGTSYYGWIQISGPVTVPTAVTTGVVGSDTMPGTADKTLVVRTGVIHGNGVLITSTAANNKVFARCPF